MRELSLMPEGSLYVMKVPFSGELRKSTSFSVSCGPDKESSCESLHHLLFLILIHILSVFLFVV